MDPTTESGTAALNEHGWGRPRMLRRPDRQPLLWTDTDERPRIAPTTELGTVPLNGHGWEGMDPAGNKMITVLVVRDVSVEHAIVDRSTAQMRG